MLAGIFDLPSVGKPGLFIAGVDARVGKTVVTCAIADVLTRFGAKVGVLKPFDMNAEKDRGNLVSQDAQALAHFAQLDPRVGSLSMVAPITYQQKHDPAVELSLAGKELDTGLIARSLGVMDEGCDIVLVEGVGGVMTPVDPKNPGVTMIDLAREMGYPVVVVTHADRGSLGLTLMSISALRDRGCIVAGIVVNYYQPDDPDPAMALTRDWLARMNRAAILATVPRVKDAAQVDVSGGRLHNEVRAAVALADWRRIAKRARPEIGGSDGGNGTDSWSGPGRKITFIGPSL